MLSKHIYNLPSDLGWFLFIHLLIIDHNFNHIYNSQLVQIFFNGLKVLRNERQVILEVYALPIHSNGKDYNSTIVEIFNLQTGK